MGDYCRPLNPEKAKAALNDILAALDLPDNAHKLTEAKTNAGNDMLRIMQYVYPIVVQIEMETITKHGFSDNREGVIQFVQQIVYLERDDSYIAELHQRIKAHYMPAITIATEAASSSL